jgi:hypothetical protein
MSQNNVEIVEYTMWWGNDQSNLNIMFIKTMEPNFQRLKMCKIMNTLFPIDLPVCVGLLVAVPRTDKLVFLFYIERIPVPVITVKNMYQGSWMARARTYKLQKFRRIEWDLLHSIVSAGSRLLEFKDLIDDVGVLLPDDIFEEAMQKCKLSVFIQ